MLPYKSKHGMSSEQAKIKKNSGHTCENEFANRIEGKVISGNGKIDVIKNNINYSIKRGFKTQWLLSSKKSLIDKLNTYNINEIENVISYFDFLPDDIEYYKNNKTKFKYNYNADLFRLFIENHLSDILDLSLSNKIIDYLVIYDDRTQINENRLSKTAKIDYNGTGNFFIFNMKDVLILLLNISINIRTTKGGKVILSNEKNIMEFELRKGTNHKKLLISSHTRYILELLKNNITYENI